MAAGNGRMRRALQVAIARHRPLRQPRKRIGKPGARHVALALDPDELDRIRAAAVPGVRSLLEGGKWRILLKLYGGRRVGRCGWPWREGGACLAVDGLVATRH